LREFHGPFADDVASKYAMAVAVDYDLAESVRAPVDGMSLPVMSPAAKMCETVVHTASRDPAGCRGGQRRAALIG
jgi:hypothetical protein